MDAFPQEFVASTPAVSGITFAGNVIECCSAIQVGRSGEPGSKGLEDKSQGVLGPTLVFESNSDFPAETVRSAFPTLTRASGFISFACNHADTGARIRSLFVRASSYGHFVCLREYFAGSDAVQGTFRLFP
jgi:hypothetical protein